MARLAPLLPRALLHRVKAKEAAQLDRAIETSEYFLCGDMREAKEVIELIGNNNFGVINLKKHGFLMYSDTLDKLRFMSRHLNFNYKRENL